jgi:hypothetical protein
MRHRSRDLGFGHHNTELLVVVAIIGIIAAIAIPTLLKAMDKRAETCLGNIATLTDGPLAKDTVCQVSGKPYAGGDTPACPEPDKHLPGNPRLVRAKEGPWRLEQTLPPFSGTPVDFMHGRLEVKEHPGRAAVLVKPGGFARFFFAPLMCLIGTVVAALFTGAFFYHLWIRKWGDAVGPFFGALIFGVVGYVAMLGFALSHEWVVEREGARITKVEYFWGKRSSEKTLTGCLGVVPARGGGGYRLFVLHPPQPDGKRITPLEVIDHDRLDVADWFNRALRGP